MHYNSFFHKTSELYVQKVAHSGQRSTKRHDSAFPRLPVIRLSEIGGAQLPLRNLLLPLFGEPVQYQHQTDIAPTHTDGVPAILYTALVKCIKKK